MGYTLLHFTEEERIFRDQMYRFADQEIAPIADEIDHNDRFPEEIIPKFSELELLQWSVPRSHGGPEGSLTMLCIAREAIARHSLSLSVWLGRTEMGLLSHYYLRVVKNKKISTSRFLQRVKLWLLLLSQNQKQDQTQHRYRLVLFEMAMTG